MTDEETWMVCVDLFCLGRPAALKMRQQLIDFLFADSKRAKRLLETNHGKFVGELAAPVPDFVLRGFYRSKVLASVQIIIDDVQK